MKAKAVRLHGANDLRLEEFELPEIKDDEILVKVVSDSVCMSTYKCAILGTAHKRVHEDVADHPAIMGHEMAGDIIKVFKNDDVPCDLVILSTNACTSSDPCFITTTNIDGETDIKNRLPLQVSAHLSIPEFLNESPLIYCESENANTSSFDGIIRLSSGASEHIGIGSVILRGCRVVFTSKCTR